MKSILLVSEAKAYGGAETYLERLGENLKHWKPKFLVPRAAELKPWIQRLEAQGLAPVLTDGGWSGLRTILAQAKSPDVELVHVNLPSTYDGGSGLLPWAIKQACGKPVVVTEHLTLIPRSRRRRWTKHRTGGAISRVITVSEASRQGLLQEGLPASRVVTIPNGVPDPGSPAPLPDTSELRVGVLAALEERKQVDLLIQAMSRIEKTNVTLTIAGDGPLRESLKRLARRLELDSRVNFVGHVKDPYKFLGDQHLLALPSRLEAMPLSVLESFACGRGVLLSALPGMAEIVDHEETGWLLSPEDVNVWSRSLERLAADGAQVQSWSLRARQVYESRFTLAASAARTEDLYREVLLES